TNTASTKIDRRKTKGSGTSLTAAGALPVAAAIRSSWPRTESVIMTSCRSLDLSRALWSKIRMYDRAVAGERGGFDDFVVPIHRHRFTLFVDQKLKESKNVLGVEARCRCRKPARDVAIADDLDAIDLGHRVGAHALDIAAAFDRQIDH